MEYNSFYGGRRGASFVIVKRYATIAEMVAAFSQGGDYKTVNYDEYVLIDTENKNDRDNGKIYRRGYEYNNAMGGAIYEGQIVGPAGMAPHTEMHTIDEVEQIQEREDFTYRRGSGSYSTVGGNLVPGKYVESGSGLEKFNDAITWAYCSVRDLNSHESTAHVGFKFPYTVIDYTTEMIEPYDDNGDYADMTNAERIDDGLHPFFEKWNISIPKGVKGDTLKNFKMVVAKSGIENYEGKADDIANGRKVLVYDYYHYDDKDSGEPVTLYLGDYNMIESFNVAADGTITIGYTHDDDTVFNKKIKWVDQITLNGDTGVFTATYNHTTDAQGNPTTYTTNLRWVNNMVLAADGTLTLKYTTGNDVILNQRIKWVTGTEILTGSTEGTGNQKLKVTYNDGTYEEIGNPLNYIIATAIDSRYHLLVYYADPAKRDAFSPKATYDGKNDWADLGYIGNGTGVGAIAGEESDAGVSAVAATMPPYSAWLIVEDDEEPSSI